MNVRILPEAEEELYQAALSYEDRESEVGLRLLAAYDEARSRIEERADHLQRLETIPPGRNIRRTFMRRFPYMVVCELFLDEVVIIAVAHIRARSQTTGRGELSSQIKSPVPRLVSLGTSSADKELADHRTASPKTPKQ